MGFTLHMKNYAEDFWRALSLVKTVIPNNGIVTRILSLYCFYNLPLSNGRFEDVEW